MKIKSPKYVIILSRKLRLNPTKYELLLWSCINKKSIGNFRFRRQHPVGRYILDFYCFKKKLAIEIDGSSHKNKKEDDEYRDQFLESCGIKTIRFSNDDIFNNWDNVLNIIKKELNN